MDLAEAKKWRLKASEAGRRYTKERLLAIRIKPVFSAMSLPRET